MDTPQFLTRWSDYIEGWTTLVCNRLVVYKAWVITGICLVALSGAGVAGYFYRNNLRVMAQQALRVPTLAIQKVAPTPEVNKEEVALLEQRVDDLVRQYQADNTYRQQLTSDFQAATKEATDNNDELVKQGQQLSQAVQDVQAEVQSLAADGAILPTTASDNSTPPSPSSSTPTGKININTATADQLDGLPGIGPSYAQAIITYRTDHGNYKSIQDIENVSGIGDATFKKLQDLITV